MANTLGVNQPPFELGETLKGTDDSSGSSVLINKEKLGVIHDFQDVDYSVSGLTSSRSLLSGHTITAVALRNESGIALLPKRVVSLTETAGRSPFTSVDGYATVLLKDRCVLVDPWLSSSGVADDDIFWGIIGGPAIVLTPTAGADFNGDIAVNAPLVAATGATSGNSTSGRVSNVTLPGTTGATAAFSAAANILGYALSAKTTGNTAADMLVHWTIKF